MALEAQPQLLSLLEKSSNPITDLTLTITVKGLFCPPEQWKITDEANPNIFGYTIQCFGVNFVGGKIQPRKLTEKEIKEQQELKSKKGAKKQTKEEEKKQEQDPQAEKKKLQWEALSEEEKFFRSSQDPYKMFSLKFPENSLVVDLKEQEIERLQKAVSSTKLQIVLIRKPQINQEELTKLKKSKPKNLNLGELYVANYIGQINLKKLSTPGQTKIIQRVQVSFNGNISAQFVKIETQKSYIFLELQLSKPIWPEIKEITPNVNELFPNFQKGSLKCSLVSKLKLEIVRAIKAISQEYSLCFSKDKQHQEDKKNNSLGSISTLRLNQINKKKDQFLNEFLNNGKYSILRQRISITIKSICIDKFRKQRIKGQISKDTIQKTLSQLNVYFQQQFLAIVDEFMSTQSQCLHEDLVLGHQNSRHSRRQALAPILNESLQEKEQRLANEYEIINQIQKAQKSYVNLVLMNDQQLVPIENYAKFCLKYKKFDHAYALYDKILKKSSNLQHKLALSILLLRKRRVSSVTNLINEMIQQSTQIENKITYNQLLSFMAEREGDIKGSQRYLAMTEKYYQIKINPNMKLNPPKNPYEEPRPKIPKPPHYNSQLTHEQSQEIRLNFINILSRYEAYDLVEQYLEKIEPCFRKQILTVQVHLFNKKYDQALTIVNGLIEKNNKNIDLLLTKGDICYKADKMFESQEIFLFLLKLKPTIIQTFSIYLRLGFTYLNRKSWQDALTVFEKATQLKQNSSLSWMGLGIANLNMERIKQAEQALDLANIYNPVDQQCERYLDKVRKIQQKQYQQNYQYLEQPIENQ